MKRMILIVDDEEPILFVLHKALVKLESDVGVDTAGTAEEALDKIREGSFDLIITDLIMPDMSGVEFTERVRALDDESVVVWMTAYHCQTFENEAERLGIYRCVEKPLEIEPFRELVRQAIALKI